VVHALAAEVSPNEKDALPNDIQWMPPGEHEITASRAGKPHRLTMRVKPEHAAIVNGKLQQMRTMADAGDGDRPFLDLNHDDREASAHPTEAFWGGDDPKTGGIRMKVNWTGAGESAVRGKNFTRFSPSFYPDKDGNVTDVPVNMGGLVNRAAFQKIQSVARAKASDDETQPNEQTTMKSLLAVLARLGLITSAELDEPSAVAQVTAKHAELLNAKTTAETELTQTKAKLTDTETKLTAAKKAHATATVDAAIQAGRIPGQNEEVKAKWVGLIEADPSNASLLPEPNEALKTLVQAGTKKEAENETGKGGKGKGAFLAKVAEYQTEHKCSEVFAIQKVAAKNPGLYDEYRASLGLGDEKKAA
jgi:phage I-like protein